ncbi:unnamed protein product [Spirodela intermedia]|uniref:Uncharacterized protein n=1 Tax=Spirodela intermedia TaxID=51605 RepID=A0A7I8L9B8_SPIIN|nr:unnamed protein product [Spirodela intermedia]
MSLLFKIYDNQRPKVACHEVMEEWKSGRLEAQSGQNCECRLESLWTDEDTCVSLPFHVTGGQPGVGQGVVVYT